MVFWNESPEARVSTIVAVVAHHPIVIKLECIAVGKPAVDVNLVVLHLQRVAFIHLDGSLVDGYVVHVECDGGPLLRYPDWSVVVAGPVCNGIPRIEIS